MAEGTPGWPGATTEQRDWVPSERVLASLDVFERHRVERPYAAAVLPEIARVTPVLDADVLEKVEEATDAVVRFDMRMAQVPIPMPAVLLRTESSSSSQIEHLTTGARQLALATLGVPSRGNAELVAANVAAMRTALTLSGPLDEDLVLAIHTALLGDTQPEIVGRWRTQQVWVGGRSVSPHGATYVPPHQDRVAALMRDLTAFAARQDVPALVQAAVVHAQFEDIHPFEDGNGRTGRTLVHHVLRRRGLARQSTVPVSAGLLRDTEAYFRALDAYRAGDVSMIVGQMCAAALDAVEVGDVLAADLTRVRERWRDALRVRSDAAAWRLADVLFAQPVVTMPWVADTLAVPQRTALNAVGALESAGILTETTAGRRNRVWQSREVLLVMEAFARMAVARSAP
jgi:Fic family protein